MRTHLTDRLPRLEESRVLQIGLVTAVTLIALALRFYKLGEWSIWIDEIFTIGRIQAHYSDWATTLRNLPPNTNWVPTSLLLSAVAINNLGVSAWSARLVPALIGVASIPLLYLLTKRLFGPAVALIAALLLAFAPWHLEWSQNARFYAGLLLFYFLAAYTFFIAIEEDRLGYLFLSGLFLALAIGERLMALFLAPAVLLYLFLLAILPLGRPSGFRKRNLAIILLPGFAFALVEGVRYLLTGRSYLTVAAELTYSLPIDDPFRLATFIAFNIGIPLMSLAAFASLFLLWQKSRAGLFMILNAAVPIILLLLANTFYFTKDRYVFMVLPFWLILAAVGIKELYARTEGAGRFLALGVLALLLADAAGDNLLYYQINHGNRHDWKSAFALVQERSQPGDQIVTWWTEFGPYYAEQELLPWGDLEPEFVLNSGQRFWFVLDEETIWGNERMKPWMEENAELIGIKYLRTINDANLHIYLYDPER
jgi:mannosyltransferase